MCKLDNFWTLLQTYFVVWKCWKFKFWKPCWPSFVAWWKSELYLYNIGQLATTLPSYWQSLMLHHFNLGHFLLLEYHTCKAWISLMILNSSSKLYSYFEIFWTNVSFLSVIIILTSITQYFHFKWNFIKKRLD